MENNNRSKYQNHKKEQKKKEEKKEEEEEDTNSSLKWQNKSQFCDWRSKLNDFLLSKKMQILTS